MAEEKTKKKRALATNISLSGDHLDEDALRGLAEREPAAFFAKTQTLIDSGEFSWGKVRNLQRLFDALWEVKVPVMADLVGGKQYAIEASAFPVLSGSLTVAAINEAYEGVPTIGQDLVTESETTKRVTEIVAITSEDLDKERVDDQEDFPLIGAGEERYEVRTWRNGRRMSIRAETIEENDVADIVNRCNALGEIAAESIEERTLKLVTDHDGSASSGAEPYALRPNGAGAALYSASANTPGTRAPSGTRLQNNTLVDETDMENARVLLAAMLNSRGKRISIPVSECTLLVPNAVAPTADKLLLSEMTPGVANEYNPWGPRGRYRPTLSSSPKLDDLSTSAWYLGWFRKQFMRIWKLRLEYVTLSGNTQAFLNSRIAFQARLAWSVGIGARDYVYVIQNLDATTAPKDE